jgi:aerotolerance regulator-like protein/VWA domain-containing protein
LNFSFLNPFFLIGLGAVAFPVLIHLISKKRGIKKSFSAVRFLLASQGEIAKRSKLKDSMLLLLRALIIAFLVVVFSKPAVFSFSPAGAQDARVVAIVIDNSFSMGYRDSFKKAKNSAERLIQSLPDGSFVAVFPLVSTENNKPEITQDRRKMTEDLINLNLSYTFADNERRLEEVFNSLGSMPNQKKELAFFTDFQRNGWTKDSFRREWFLPIDVSPASEIENRAVSDVGFKDEGSSIRISVKVSNYSKNALSNLLVTVLLDSKEIKGFVNIEGKSEEIKDFVVPKESLHKGERSGKVEISHDNLTADDVRYFVLSQTEEPRVLIVDGDPREYARLSETYYLARAVETISEILPLRMSIKDNESFLDEKLKKYNIIFLANVGDITPQKAGEMDEFIKSGGTVVIFLGDRVRRDVYNALFKDVLPVEIGDLSEGDYSLGVHELNKFTEGIDEKLNQVKVKKLFNLHPAKDSSTILEASNNFPFLIRGKAGRGDIYLFASTADTAWNNFSLTPVFLPTIKKIFDLPSVESQRKNFIVGEPVDISFPEGVDEIEVENPQGDKIKIYRESPRFTKTLIPGIYTVKLGEGKGYRFCMNVDTRESNLEKISLKTSSSKPSQQNGLAKVFKEIWSYFLFGVIALFITESVLRALYTK